MSLVVEKEIEYLQRMRAGSFFVVVLLVRTGWVEQEDYPDIEELDLGMEFDPGDEEVLAALDDHPCRQGDKVSGYPFWYVVVISPFVVVV